MLDPYDVTIAHGRSANSNETCSGSPQTCTPSGNATIYDANISSTLSGGTSMTITTGGSGSAGTSNGDITVNTGVAITDTSATATSLTLSAYRNITFSGTASITASNGAMDLILDADNAGNHSGYVILGSGTITTNGGNITIGGGNLTGGLPSGGAWGDSGTIQDGVYLTGTTLTAGAGNITITADGGTGTGNYGGGLSISSATLSTSSGNIMLAGTANDTGSTDVHVAGVGLSGTNALSTTGGNISITGTAAASGSSDDYGVIFSGTTTTFSTAGSGASSITGYGGGSATGANGYGVTLNTATVTATYGNALTITGTGGSGSGTLNNGIFLYNGANTISSTGGGALTLIGIAGGGSAHGIATGGGGNATIGGASENGDITLQWSSTLLFNYLGGNTTISTPGNITLKEYTPGTAIAVDSASGLGLTTAYLADFSWGSSKTLTIGDANAGDITANADSALLNIGNVTLVSGGNITVAGAWSKTSGSKDTFTLEAGDNITQNYAISGASGYALNVVMDANTSGTGGYIYLSQYNGTGITTWGGDIYMGGGSLDGSGHPTSYALGNATNGKQYGIVLNGGDTLNAGGGNIVMTGHGGTNAGNDWGINIGGSTVETSGTGNITLTGYAGAVGAGVGIVQAGVSSSSVTSTGSGAINIVGVGAGGGVGIKDDTDGDIIGASSGYSGNITLQADSVSFGTETVIKTSGNIQVEPYTPGGTIEVDASSGGTLNLTAANLAFLNWGGTLTIGASNAGDITANADSALLNVGNVTLETGGNITVAGAWTKASGSADTLTFQAGKNITLGTNDTISGASGYALNVLMDSDYGGTSGYIYLNSGANITTYGGNITMGGGNGTISAGSGYAVGSSSNNTQYGIYIGTLTLNAGGGNIVLNGQGGTYSGGSNVGIYDYNGTITTSGTGTINWHGLGGTADTAGSDLGVYLYAASIAPSGTGLVSITGTGGGASGSGGNNFGVDATAANTIAPTGAAPITITGTQGDSTTYGEWLTNTITSHGGTVTLASPTSIYQPTITYASGTSFDIVIDANTGGTGGVIYSNNHSLSTNGGNIYMGGGALDGSGHPTGAAEIFVGGNINAGGGNITMTGHGYGLASGSGAAVNVWDNTIQTSGTGTINITSTAGSNTWGVYVGQGGSSGITSTGSGAINITGIGNNGIGTNTNTDTIGGSSYSGNLTLTADTVSFGTGTSIQTSGNITVKEYTANQTIGVGTGTGNLALTDTYLGYFTFGSGKTFTIGDANAGAIDINSANTLLNTGNVTYISGGSITVDHAISKTAGATDALTLQAGTNIIQNNTISGASGYALNVIMDSDYANGAGGGYISLSANITTWGGNITIGGGNGTISAGSGYAVGSSSNGAASSGIFSSDTLNAGGGNIVMNGQGGTDASGNDHGIYLFNTTVETSGSGTITLTGSGGSGGFGNYGINTDGSTVQTSGAGAIMVTGIGGTASGSNNSGIGMVFTNSITSTSNGTITVVGEAGSAGGGTYGIVTDTYTETIGASSGYSGNITLKADTVSFGTGTVIKTSGNIQVEPYTTGANITVDGTSGSVLNLTAANLAYLNWGGTLTIGASNAGDITANADSALLNVGNVTLETGGNITTAGNWSKTSGSADTLTFQAGKNITLGTSDTISGASGYALNVLMDSDYGGTSGYIYLNSGANITSDGGNITMGGGNGTISAGSGYAVGSSASNTQYGIYVADTLDAGGGNIILNGQGGTYASGGNVGINLHNGGTIKTSGTGTITLYGTSGTGGGSDDGIDVAGSIAPSGTGQITLNGTATGGSGIYIANGSIAPTGAAPITIIGSATGNQWGIWHRSGSITSHGGTVTLESPGGINISAPITYAAGTSNDVVVDANSGSAGGFALINIGANISTNGGNIYLGGGALDGSGHPTGAASGSPYNGTQYGIYVNSNYTINAGGGNIILNGQGGTYASGGDDGIFLDGATVETSGTGVITLTGTGGTSTSGTNYGVYLDKNTSASSITSTGSGAINVTGISGSGGTEYGSGTDANADIIGAASGYSGNITLQADSVSFGTGTVIGTTGNILIEPYTATTAVNVINGAFGLALTTAELGYLSGGSYAIGNANDTGTMTLGSASWNAPVSFLAKSTGSIDVTGTQTGTGSATISFTGPTTLGYAGTDVTTNNEAITFNSAVTLAANATVNSGTATTSFGTVNGDYNLTASAGTFSLASAWGGGAPLAAVSLTSANGLTLPAISAASIFAQTTGAAADLTLSGQLTASGTGNAVTLVAGRNFVNEAGSGVISLTGGSAPDWLIYSTNPGANTLDGLAESYHRYSCTYGGLCPALGTGNGLLYSLSPALTVTANDDSGTYGSIAAFSAGYSGFINGDTAGTALSGSASLTTNATTSTSGNYNTGSWTITSAAGTLASALGYQLSYVNGTLSVAQKSVSISGVTATDKVYDSTTADTLNTGSESITGKVTGDNVSIGNGTGAFGNANVGTNKTVTASGFSLTGADAGDYSLSGQPGGLTANITTASLTVTAKNVNMTYADGTTLNGTTGFTTSGLLGSDSVSSATLATNATTSTSGNWNAGTWTITSSAALGSGLSNYSITYATGTQTINAKSVSISGVAATNKVYDSTTADTLNTGSESITGKVTGDNVSISNGTGAFSDANVGTNKTVNASGFGLTGADAGDYSLSAQPSALSANITAAGLTVTAKNVTMTYADGTTLNGTTGFTTSGLLGSDSVSSVTLGTNATTSTAPATGTPVPGPSPPAPRWVPA